MSRTTAAIGASQALLHTNDAWAGVGDVAGLQPSTADGNLVLSLHTAWPGLAGNQTTSEIAYTDYARRTVARTGSGWSVSAPQVSNAAQVQFPICGATGGVATYVGIGTDSTGTGNLLDWAPISSADWAFTAKTDDSITVPGHTLVVDDRVVFHKLFDYDLPTGITEGTAYYVITVSGNDITVSTSMGGSALNITAAGVGLVYRLTPLTIVGGLIPTINIGGAVIQEM